MANYIIYPNPAFQPRTDYLPDGTIVAYDAFSGLWATLTGLIYKQLSDGSWIKKHIIGCNRPFVRKPHQHSQYPLVNNGRRTPFSVHTIMARAWIGSIPDGWQVDHIDGNIRNANVFNIRILPTWLNHRDGGFLRKLRHRKIDRPSLMLVFGAQQSGTSALPQDPYERALYIRDMFLRFFDRLATYRATHTPTQYTRLSRPDLLALFTANNVAGDVYEGD